MSGRAVVNERPRNAVRDRLMRAVVTLVVVGSPACAARAPAGSPTAASASSSPVTDAPASSGSAAPDGHDAGESPRAPLGPPPVTLRAGGSPVVVEAYLFCFESACNAADPPKDLPDLGRAERIVVSYPLEGWTFDASFRAANAGEQAREQLTTLQANPDGTFTLEPVGRAGAYDVIVNGQGRGQGSFAFRWTTTSDGPLAKPSASLAVMSGGADGVIDSFGVSLGVSNLARTPKSSAATITVRSSDGQSTTLKATRSSEVPLGREGSVYWDGPDFPPQRKGGPVPAADALGKAPFTIDVALSLDGSTYHAQAEWPRDVMTGNEPYMRLDFAPSLPALK